jgi:site-specific recombinase XerD
MSPGVRGLLFNMKLKPVSTEHRFIFKGAKGEPVEYGHVYRDFKKAQKNAGFTSLIRFHDLRHTFASQFVMNGGNLFDLQKILGHTQINMTMRYAHFSPDHLQNSIKYIDFGMNPPHIPHGKLEENNLSLISKG